MKVSFIVLCSYEIGGMLYIYGNGEILLFWWCEVTNRLNEQPYEQPQLHNHPMK